MEILNQLQPHHTKILIYTFIVFGIFGVSMAFILQALMSRKSKTITPYSFNETLYFVQNDERTNKFVLMKGKAVKMRKEITTTQYGKETISYSYKLMSDGKVTDFISHKFVHNDVDNVLTQLDILGEVKKKYSK